MTDERGAGPPGRVEHEKTDVDPASITKAAVLVVGVTTLTGLALVAYIGVLQRGQAERDPAPRAVTLEAGRQPPRPRLQEAPFQDVRALRADEDRLLGGYGWVDRQAGVVHIPIDDAMRLYVQRAAAGRLTVGPPPPPASPGAPADAGPAPPSAGAGRPGPGGSP